MYCRFANQEDKKFIIYLIKNKKIDYITPAHIKEDIANRRLIVCIDSNKIVSFCAIVFEPLYNYYAIKRLLIPNKKNLGHSCCSMLLDYAESILDNLPIGATPFYDNIKCRAIFEKRKYIFKYQFGNYCFYLKE